jgi:hypothetical protein
VAEWCGALLKMPSRSTINISWNQQCLRSWYKMYWFLSNFWSQCLNRINLFNFLAKIMWDCYSCHVPIWPIISPDSVFTWNHIGMHWYPFLQNLKLARRRMNLRCYQRYATRILTRSCWSLTMRGNSQRCSHCQERLQRGLQRHRIKVSSPNKCKWCGAATGQPDQHSAL